MGLLNQFVCAIAVFASVFAAPTARGQSADPATTKQLQNAANQGIPLRSTTNVADNVSVEAVLLPAAICKHVFGKEIANNYAVVELIISNRSDDASLIVHSIFIDYSQWALSGFSQTPTASAGNQQQPSQAINIPTQVASAEYRVARGQLLDAQPWTIRNALIRALQAVGSIATAYTFTIGGQHAVRSIGAYNGAVVPAIDTFWPDATIGQMNRISDLGFQVNKVISKDSSDIIVAFFPIDRFLTPGLKKLFLKNPAMFFAPNAMLIDPQGREALAMLIKPLFKTEEEFNCFLNEVSAEFVNDKPGPKSRFLDSVSLNRLRLVVGGIMTIDVNNVPANINSVEMDGGNDDGSVWTDTGEKTGAIRGSFLLSGTPTIAGPDQLKITDIAVVPAGSTAYELHFKMKLGTALTTNQKLTFKVVKKNAQSKDVESMPFDLVIPEYKFKINSVEMATGNDNPQVWTDVGEKTGIIKGSSLLGGTPVIAGADQLQITDLAAVSEGSTDSELHFKMKLGKPLKSGDTLPFQVVKKDKQNKDLNTTPFNFAIPSFATGNTPPK
jgi:hypothetical protein